MAKNKRNIDLDIKKKELEETAARLFMEDGFEATSMNRISRALGVAPNTLYWYYASKDELLVGVLNRLLSDTLKQIPSVTGKSIEEQMGWVLQQFEQSRALMTTVHSRLNQSLVIHDWHEQFHSFLETLVVRSLKAHGVCDQRADTLATVAIFLIEGLLAHPHSEKQRSDILEWFAQHTAADQK